MYYLPGSLVKVKKRCDFSKRYVSERCIPELKTPKLDTSRLRVFTLPSRFIVRREIKYFPD